MSTPALVLLDFQVDFLDPAGRLPIDPAAAEALIRNTQRLIARQTAAGGPLVVVANAFGRRDAIGNWFRRGAAVEGSPGARLDARLQVPAGAVHFAKSRSSAFTQPDLEPFLRARGVTALCLCGVFAEGCVRATAIDALKRGFEVHVPADLVASNAAWKTRWALRSMRRQGAHIDPAIGPPSPAERDGG